MAQSNWVLIDFSDWSNKKQEFLELLKDSILNRRILLFTYYSSAGEKTKRRVCPVQLWFKGKTWYLKAYCLEKKGMRTFRLTRMRDVAPTGESFQESLLKGETKDTEMQGGNLSSGSSKMPLTFTLLIRKEMAFRVYDEFDEEEISETEDGDYLIRARYPLDSWVYGTILSYGDKARVVEPEFLRREIAGLGEKIRNINSEISEI